MITGASFGTSAQVLNPAQSSATKAAGLVFDNVLSGLIKGKEPATIMQEEPPVSVETKDPEESTDDETAEQAYMNLFPYRMLQDGQSLESGGNVRTDEKADRMGIWVDSVTEKQLVMTAKLDYAAPETRTSTQPEQIEASSRLENLTLSDANISTTASTTASGTQAGEQAFTPESTGIRESGEKERNLTDADTWKQQFDRILAGSEIPIEQRAEYSLEPDESLTNFPKTYATVDSGPESNYAEQPTELQARETTVQQPIADEEEKVDQPKATAKTPNANEAQVNQGLLIREQSTESLVGQKPSKVIASHIKDIQKTIEIQIEKTPVLGTTVVKILLTPDNIGDIHVQLIKTKDSITAVLYVQDSETKGLLEDQLPLLLEPFKHSNSESPIALTVVADASLAFSFSEGADPGHRKMERQESRKRTSKEKTDEKEQPMKKKSTSGLSLLA